MNNWLVIALYFFACIVASAPIVAVSLILMVGRDMRSLWGLTVSASVAEKLAPYGLLLPFAIFAAGAYLAQKPLHQTNLPGSARLAFSLAFALFPLAVYLSWSRIMEALEKVYSLVMWPRLARLQEFERKLKSAPVVVAVKRARLLGETRMGGVLELTVEVKGVPPLKYYELNMHQLGGGGGEFPDGDYSDEGYEQSCKVFYEGGRWEFRGYHLGRTLTSAEDTFTTRIRYPKPQEGRPRRIRFRLGVWKREDKVYRNTCIFFYDWVTLPELTIEETP
jgi:hypothetical protein